MSTISTEVRAPVVGIPEGASARVVALPCGRFRLRVRDGLLAASVGEATVRIENGVVRMSARRPPRWSALVAPVMPLGFAAATALLALGSSALPAFLAAWATAVVMVVVAILRGVLAVREEATVSAADTFVIAVKRPWALDRIERLLGGAERLLPRALADLVGRRVVVVEAPFGADRLAIRRRALACRKVTTAEALVRALRAAHVPRARA